MGLKKTFFEEGKYYGDFKILKLSHKTSTYVYHWLCECKCGKIFTRSETSLRSSPKQCKHVKDKNIIELKKIRSNEIQLMKQNLKSNKIDSAIQHYREAILLSILLGMTLPKNPFTNIKFKQIQKNIHTHQSHKKQ